MGQNLKFKVGDKVKLKKPFIAYCPRKDWWDEWKKIECVRVTIVDIQEPVYLIDFGNYIYAIHESGIVVPFNCLE